jgi:hypothetical protein
VNLSTLRWRLAGDTATVVIPDEPRSGDDPGSIPERL